MAEPVLAEPELAEVDRHCSSDSDSDNELVLVKKVKWKAWYGGVKGDESGKLVKEDIDKPVCKLCKKSVLAKRSIVIQQIFFIIY